MASNYQFFPGRVKFESLVISNNFDKIEVLDLLVELNLNTSINSISASGEFMLLDARNILNSYKINAGDTVIFKVSYADITKKFTFRVQAIESLQQVDKQRMYSISCISPFAYVCQHKIIEGALKGSPSEIAKGLFLENGEETMGVWEDSIGSQKLVIPRWTLGYTMQWLADRAAWANDLVRFKFFQDSNMKYHFMPIEKAREIYKEKPVIKYTNNLIVGTKGDNQAPNSADANRAIRDIIFEDSFNISKALKSGKIYGTRYSPDIISKSYEPKVFSYFDNFVAENSLNGFPQFRNDEYGSAYNQYSIDTSYTQDEVDKLNKVSDASQVRKTTIDDSQIVSITVIGNQLVDIGQVIELEIPSPESVTDQSKNKLDTRWSGKYYVVAKRDMFDRTEETHVMSLGLAKESQLEKATK